jgi:phage terminase large subunit-like protein
MGKKWDLQPFQVFYFMQVYGWVNSETNFRRFTKAYTSTGRKSSKSEMVGGECTYHLLHGVGSPQVVCAATTRKQAAYVYDPSVYMLTEAAKESKWVRERVKKTQYEVKNLINRGVLFCLTGDASTQDGGNIQFASIDEYHAHDNNSIVKVVETGMGFRDEPLCKISTTAGFNKNGPDYEFRNYVVKVLNGDLANDRLFGFIHDMDEGDDWENEINWYKPNPLMPISPKMDWMQGQYLEAKQNGGEFEVEFKTKNLNMYVDAAKVWINLDLYKKIGSRIDVGDLLGLRCIVGMDLASVSDLTAVTYYFPDLNYYYTDYYCPESKFKVTRTDGVIYSEFEKNGWVKRTPGNVIDAQFIIKDILDNAQKYKILRIGYDPHKSIDIITVLEGNDLECFKVPQSATVLGNGVSFFKKGILNGRLRHDGNQCSVWQFGNITVYKDGNGNEKFLKSENKKENKIDGPVSMAISFTTWLDYNKDAKEELTLDNIGLLSI